MMRGDGLIHRIVENWQSRGAAYVWHKALRRSLGRWPGLKRRLLYADQRHYWTMRGGADYFAEQEGQPARSERAQWMAARIARLNPKSILEVGCGYGKQLFELRTLLPEVPMVGLDFSTTQLNQARIFLRGLSGIHLVQGDGARLPFESDAFDLVLTSAVILHNPPPIAARMREEVVRVGFRYAVHNEDTDVTYNRYGYDTAGWYQTRGIPLSEVGSIPVAPLAKNTQFCVARLLAT
jgi:SAM-dependent methyltransferase